ncbi:protein FAM3D isoform X1 [Heterocephalus glaber]|uniref:Protein FAM3D isoform X1 n=1 Tax=Heterocephalus glaber TaxID=10181 RepID=A0AAX6RUE1_HETGA|nr:protein FAM3D isoform X1 [Heterocephalus glaber]XP_021099719.1 protein FAM3D isoform X1 [Heterocephalus glaber]
MRVSGLLRLLSLIATLVATWLFLRSSGSLSVKTIRLPRWLGLAPKEIRVPKTKCGLSKPCPANFFAFKICSGAANVVGPSMCFENQILMSPVKNNVGRGLNIALVNDLRLLSSRFLKKTSSMLHVAGSDRLLSCPLGTTGQMVRMSSFDMYSGDPSLLLKFLTEISEGTLVLAASYDDPGTKMTDDIRKLFSSLGSSYAQQLGFRDSWVFLGAKDLRNKSPFEQFLKSNPETNKYEGWPELLELEGCVPQKTF